MGMGPMTGWGRGLCAGAPKSGWFGRGGGRGWRNRFYATGLPGWQRNVPGRAAGNLPDETGRLKEQAEYLSTELEAVRTRLNELEQKKGK